MSTQNPPKLRHGLTIRAALFTALFCMAAFGTAALGWRATQDWNELRIAQAGAVANAGANHFITGLFEVLMERLTTNNALQAASPVSPGVRQEIERRRGVVRENFVPGRAVLTTLDFPGREALLANLDTALARADAIRARADAALPQPRDARDAALLRDYIPTITASVDAALRVWFAAVHVIAIQDPALTRLAMIKELGWRLRDISGFERSNIASAMAAGQPVPADRLAANAASRTRVDLLWSELINLAPPADTATGPQLRDAMAVAQREYFEGFRGLSDRMVQAGAAAPGGQYPMGTAEYVTTTTAQIGTLLEIMHAAGRVSEAQAAGIVAGRKADLALALGLLTAGLAIAGLAGWIVVARVTRPLRALQTATARLADGDLGTTIPAADRVDEVGRLAAAIRVLQAGLADKARLEAAQEGDKAHAEAEKRAVVQHMAEAVEGAARSAAERIGQRSTAMRADADALARTAVEVAGSATQVTETAARVMADTEAGAAATEQLGASIREVTAQVEGATAAARRAVQRTETSQASIAGLSEAATRIADVVRLIADIAGRTNLLALNATIEAARAGDAGKGFAVVASEVKALASQTAKATEEISRQVQEIGSATAGAVAAVGEIAEAIRETDQAAGAIAAVMQHQADATAEISRTVARTATAARDVADRIGEVSTAVAGAGRRADAVRIAAAEAETETARLQSSIVGIIRTATPEANRRAVPRHPGQGRRASLEGAVPGQAALPGTLQDVSAGGAALLLPPGTTVPHRNASGRLRIDGMATPVPVTVIGNNTAEPGGGIRLRLQFGTLDAATQAELAGFLARLSAEPEARRQAA